MTTAFEISQSLTLRINNFTNAALSLAHYVSTPELSVVSAPQERAQRLSISEHGSRLIKEGRLNGDKPTLVLSVRNVLSNLRCGAWVRGLTTEFISVAEENPSLSERPYHVLALHNGRMEMMEYMAAGAGSKDLDWVISGVPVLWDDNEDLFERIVTEAADHSHVWRIPRGNHPDATPESRAQWENLHEGFHKTLYMPRKEAFQEIAGRSKGLEREDKYLHNIIGVDENGSIVQKIGIGRLEELGTELKALGVRRAIMVDNGGSPVVQYFQKGVAAGESVQVFSAPNHRPFGKAFVFIELSDTKFAML